jgi:anti-sigma-K factor RskA
MAETDPKLFDLLPAYVLGALEEEDRQALEAALAAGDPDLERELAAWTGQLEALAATVPPVEPSPMTRARLLRAVGEQAAAARGPRSWLLAASLLLALLGGWLALENVRLRDRLDTVAAERDRLAQEQLALARDLESTRQDLERTVMAGRIVGAPGTRAVLLAGLGSIPGATGHAYHDPGTRQAVFYASDLPLLAADKDYQLWFIADGVPVSAGVFEIDEGGRATVLVADVAAPESVQAWAVTVEPAGGVPQPTGEMVLKG